jgi:hypothetical protein
MLNHVGTHTSAGLEVSTTKKTPTLDRASARPRATREPRRLAELPLTLRIAHGH